MSTNIAQLENIKTKQQMAILLFTTITIRCKPISNLVRQFLLSMPNGTCKQDLTLKKRENIDQLEDLSMSITFDLNGYFELKAKHERLHL
jgi:hypothetical protein